MTEELAVGGIFADHVCFGCGQQIKDFQPHIHVGMDEFSRSKGLAPLGMDDLLTFAFCEECTVKGGQWTPESHEIEPT